MAGITLELIANVQLDYGAPEEWSIPLYVHVHNRIEQFIYLNEINEESVPIAYLENQELDSWRNLHIANRTYQIPGNALPRIYKRASWDKVSSSSFSSQYSKVLITHETFVDEQGKIRPLFWKHVLPDNVSEVSLSVVTGGERHNVDTGYLVKLSERALYTNYENFFDPDTGAYKLFFVVATGSDGEISRSLLNPVPVVDEATWEDIDLETGTFYEGIRVYSRDTTGAGTTFYFSQGDTYYIRPYEASLIQPYRPFGREPEDTWYLRFSAGNLTTVVNGGAKQYHVPEFDQQNFVPYKPYLYSPYGTFNWVNDRVLAATRGGLKVQSDEGFDLTFFVYNVDGDLLRVFTTNTALDGQRYSDTNVFYESDKILSIDEHGGIVSLSTKIHPSWTIKGKYFYKAEDFEYTRLNLNPLSNKQMLDHIAVFYMIPGADSEDRAIHHLLVDRSGIIRYTSQADGFVYDNLQLTNEDGSFNANTVVGLKYISDHDSVDTFVTMYTAGYDNTFGYAVLAEVSFLDLAKPEDQYIYDVRRPGGTLDLETLEDAFRANPKLLQSIHGYGEDGQEIPLNGVVIISVPLTLLDEYGGVLKEEAVKQLVTQHLDASVYPIIQWDYPASQIDIDPTESDQLTLSWTWEGPDLTYVLYRKKNPTGTWEVIHTLEDPEEAVLTYVDTDVESSGVYYYTIGIEAQGVSFPYGNTISAKVRT